MKKIVFVIPAKDPDISKLSKIVDKVKEFGKVIVVNDGSKEKFSLDCEIIDLPRSYGEHMAEYAGIIFGFLKYNPDKFIILHDDHIDYLDKIPQLIERRIFSFSRKHKFISKIFRIAAEIFIVKEMKQKNLFDQKPLKTITKEEIFRIINPYELLFIPTEKVEWIELERYKDFEKRTKSRYDIYRKFRLFFNLIYFSSFPLFLLITSLVLGFLSSFHKIFLIPFTTTILILILYEITKIKEIKDKREIIKIIMENFLKNIIDF